MRTYACYAFSGGRMLCHVFRGVGLSFFVAMLFRRFWYLVVAVRPFHCWRMPANDGRHLGFPRVHVNRSFVPGANNCNLRGGSPFIFTRGRAAFFLDSSAARTEQKAKHFACHLGHAVVKTGTRLGPFGLS